MHMELKKNLMLRKKMYEDYRKALRANKEESPNTVSQSRRPTNPAKPHSR